MLIDTHCHLDAEEFNGDRDAVVHRARSAGVRAIVIPAVQVSNFALVRKLAHSFDGGAYALGIHPLYVPQAREHDIQTLQHAIEQSLDDPRFVALGEIGLDFFVPELCEPAIRERQEWFYKEQLRLARRYGLPVLLHVRRSQDCLLKHLRSGSRVGGIAHAFNGSFQQAQQFIGQGFALGFGGTLTFTRSLQIRRLARQLTLDAIVLETDAPDIPPAWLGTPDNPGKRNEPANVARIAGVMADLRQASLATVLNGTAATASRVLPRLAAALSTPTGF
jgi:TatD DNase family protein